MINLNIYYRAFLPKLFDYKILIILFSFFFGSFSFHLVAQSSEELEKYYQNQSAKNDTLIQLHKDKKGLLWLNLLPNVIYDIDRNVFNLSLNLSSISVYLQQKNRNKIERSKLQIQLSEKLDNEYLLLQKEFDQLEKDSIESTLLESNYNLSKQLFSLLEKQYLNNKINSETWLKFQQDHLATELKFKASQKAYFIRKSNLKRRLDE